MKTLAGAMLAAAQASVPTTTNDMLRGDEPWRVEIVRNACELSRSFGRSRTRLAITRAPTTNYATVALATRTTPAKVALGWRPARLATDLGFVVNLHARSNGMPRTRPAAQYQLTMPGVTRQSVSALSRGRTIDISVEQAPVASLATDGIGIALLQLAQCEDALAERWGLDVDAARAIVVWPEPLLGQAHFPDLVNLTKRVEAIVLRYRVQPDGRASRCTAIESSGNPAVDRAYCEAIEATHYSPALDKSGRAVEVVATKTDFYDAG